MNSLRLSRIAAGQTQLRETTSLDAKIPREDPYLHKGSWARRQVLHDCANFTTDELHLPVTPLSTA